MAGRLWGLWTLSIRPYVVREDSSAWSFLLWDQRREKSIGSREGEVALRTALETVDCED